MNTSQLRCATDCDPVMRKKVLGVYARDEVPKEIRTFPTGYIVNTDKSDGLGKHWVAFYGESKEEKEFFDSYGHSPSHFSFEANTYNDKRLQSNTSRVCGQYCLYYLLNRCRGVTMESLLRPFGNDLKANDNYVYEYIQTSFPYCFYHTCTRQTCCAEL